MDKFTQKYESLLRGTISCYDRVIIQGTLPGICYAKGMTSFLAAENIRIFDYPAYAKGLRDQIRAHVAEVAEDARVEIVFVKNKKTRKEQVVAKILEKRGDTPGLVTILSAMESCPAYTPWHDKKTHKTYLKSTSGQCLHYYFYFIDEVLGLTYVRVPTWCPFRLQIYFNGHNWLAGVLKAQQVSFKLADNAFIEMGNWFVAQDFANHHLIIRDMHQRLDQFAERYCPIFRKFGVFYHWSVMQAEFATDLVFKRQRDLEPIYEHIVRTAIHAVKPGKIATFLGRKLHGNYQDELGNRFDMRHEGSCLKHRMGPVSIKMYDKYHLVLRIETTVNDLSFFKHYRVVEQRDGSKQYKYAPMKKGIYSLPSLHLLLMAANRRYLDFLASLGNPTVGVRKLAKITKTVRQNNRTYKGFHFLRDEDTKVFQALLSGEFNISGFKNKTLRQKIPGLSGSQVSRLLKRLRVHGLVKKVGRTFKYYLTSLGRKVLAMALKLKHQVIIPQLDDCSY